MNQIPVGYAIAYSSGKWFKTIERNENGERYPVFTDKIVNARIYTNKDNAEQVLDWVRHWIVRNKDQKNSVWTPFTKLERTYIFPDYTNVKWSD